MGAGLRGPLLSTGDKERFGRFTLSWYAANEGEGSKDARAASSGAEPRPRLVIRTPVSVTVRIAGAGDFSLMTICTLMLPNSSELTLRRMWLRQKVLLTLAANFLGRLTAFVRCWPQDEGDSALPNPHSQSPWTAGSGQATLRWCCRRQ
jgi:hypothetical protein